MPTFNIEQKIESVVRYQQGTEEVKSIAKSIRVHHTVLLNWIKQYEHHGGNALKSPYILHNTV